MLQFKSLDDLNYHFAKHNSQFNDMYTNANEYLAGANKVIQNGTYNSDLNGYIQFYRTTSKGKNLYHFVGLTRSTPTYITTYYPRIL